MRSLSVAGACVLFIAGCGDNTGGNPDASIDGPVAIDSGPIEPAVTWQLMSVPITRFTLMEETTLNTERTVRILATTYVSGCQTFAMPAVSYANQAQEVSVDMRVWDSRGLVCPEAGAAPGAADRGMEVIEEVERPVSLRLPGEGTWTIRAGSPDSTAEDLTVEILPPPMRPCYPVDTGCEMDCDCPQGQACLSGTSLSGPFTQCALPCELDRDCLGTGRCLSAVDGLSFFCDDTLPECMDGVSCPRGYACQEQACALDVVLGQITRTLCTGDADCVEPLRCVEPLEPDGEKRCELACPTASPGWCSAAHYCGNASDDVSGLADSDAVCIWAGE